MRTVAPELVVLFVLLIFSGLGLVIREAIRNWQPGRRRAALAAERAARAEMLAIASARWETYAEPDGGGQVRIGVHLVARVEPGQMRVLRDDPVETVPASDNIRRVTAVAEAIDRRDLYNGLLPSRDGEIQ
jgi:hypothetical protein